MSVPGKPLHVLVAGAGAYVVGRGSSGFGTVLPAILQASKNQPIERVTVAATRADNDKVVAGKAAELQRLLGTSVKVEYQNWQTVERLSDYHCAIVVVPDDKHLEVTSALLARKIHALVVKPLAPTLKDARSLVSSAQTNCVYGAVEYHKRFDEANLVVRRQIQAGELGDLSYGLVSYSQRVSVPAETFRTWVERTNVFQYLGVHYVDLFYFMTGFSPMRVSARGNHGILQARGIDAFDSVHATVEWRNPATPLRPFLTTFVVGWVDPEGSSAMSEQRYSLVGSRGRIDCDQKNRGLDVASNVNFAAVNPYFTQFIDRGGGTQDVIGYGPQSVMTFLGDVRAIVSGEHKPADFEGIRPTFADALPSTAVVEAVEHSLRADGAWCEVEAC